MDLKAQLLVFYRLLALEQLDLLVALDEIFSGILVPSAHNEKKNNIITIINY